MKIFSSILKLVFPLLLILSFNYSYGQVSVKGYYKKNGTYVEPHMRSSPDKNPYNNYSFPGNVNPYTGKVAGGNPDTYLKKYNKNYQGNNYSGINSGNYDSYYSGNYSGEYGYYKYNDIFLDIGFQATTAAPLGGFILFGNGTNEKDWFLGSEIGVGIEGISKAYNGWTQDNYWTGLIGIKKVYFGVGITNVVFNYKDGVHYGSQHEDLWTAGYYNWKNHISYKFGVMYSRHSSVNLSLGLGFKFY